MVIVQVTGFQESLGLCSFLSFAFQSFLSTISMYRISIIPIKFCYDLYMTKKFIFWQFNDPINQMIIAAILNRVCFRNEIGIQQCVFFQLRSDTPSIQTVLFFQLSNVSNIVIFPGFCQILMLSVVLNFLKKCAKRFCSPAIELPAFCFTCQ